MNLVGFLVIFLCLFVGQMIVQFFNLPLPPSIIGLILLFLLLQFKVVPLKAVQPISAVFFGLFGVFGGTGDHFGDVVFGCRQARPGLHSLPVRRSAPYWCY